MPKSNFYVQKYTFDTNISVLTIGLAINLLKTFRFFWWMNLPEFQKHPHPADREHMALSPWPQYPVNTMNPVLTLISSSSCLLLPFVILLVTRVFSVVVSCWSRSVSLAMVWLSADQTPAGSRVCCRMISCNFSSSSWASLWEGGGSDWHTHGGETSEASLPRQYHSWYITIPLW